jgi:hypothetical protein
VGRKILINYNSVIFVVDPERLQPRSMLQNLNLLNRRSVSCKLLPNPRYHTLLQVNLLQKQREEFMEIESGGLWEVAYLFA